MFKSAKVKFECGIENMLEGGICTVRRNLFGDGKKNGGEIGRVACRRIRVGRPRMNPLAYGAQESVLMNAGLAEPDSGKVDLSGELCAGAWFPAIVQAMLRLTRP